MFFYQTFQNESFYKMLHHNINKFAKPSSLVLSVIYIVTYRFIFTKNKQECIPIEGPLPTSREKSKHLQLDSGMTLTSKWPDRQMTLTLMIILIS